MRKNVFWVIGNRIFMFVIVVGVFVKATPILGQVAGVVALNSDTQIGFCLAISPDEKHLYAGGSGALVVFERGLDGTLRAEQVLNNDHLGMSGISQVSDMIVSRDGRYLYAVNQLESRVNVFARDSASGQIQLINFFGDEIFGADLWNNIPHYELIQNPDGGRLYWLNTKGDSSRAHNVLAVLERDWATGKLSILQTLHGGEAELGFYKMPLALTMTPDGKNLYGCGNNGPFLLEFRCDTLSGKITWTKALPVNLGAVNAWDQGSITVSPEGKFIYATNMFADKLFVIARSPENDELRLHASLFFSTPSTSFLSPKGDFLYLLNSDVIASFTRDVTTGNLTRSDSFQLRNATSSHNFVVSPVGNNIYLNVNVDLSSTIQAIERDPSSGSLKIIQQMDDLGGTDRLYGGRAVEVSPNGERLYVGTDLDAAINVFARDQAQGRLALVEADSVGQISAMKISPQGEHLYATTQKNEIKAFALDAHSGATNLVQTLTDTVRQYHTLAFSSDGRQLYLADFKRIKVFARDPASGLLTGIQSFTRAGLWYDRAMALEVSPEGKHVYWQSGDEISTLVRDATNGKLACSDSLRMSLRDYDYVLGQRALQISPDGKHVYAGITAYKYFDDGEHFAHPKVISFERNPLSGMLTVMDVVAPRHEWDRWDQMRDLALSADGKELYAVLDDGDSKAGLAMLARDAETGKLGQRAFFEVINWSFTDAALSPDGGFLYFSDQIGVTTFATGRRITSGVGENSGFAALLPRTLSLEQNYPNPFSSSTHTSQRTTVIHYEIIATQSNAQSVELAIYNTQGQLVRMLVNEAQTIGKHAATWNGMNARGQLVPSGVYFYRLKMGGQVMTRKMLVVR